MKGTSNEKHMLPKMGPLGPQPMNHFTTTKNFRARKSEEIAVIEGIEFLFQRKKGGFEPNGQCKSNVASAPRGNPDEKKGIRRPLDLSGGPTRFQGLAQRYECIVTCFEGQ